MLSVFAKCAINSAMIMIWYIDFMNVVSGFLVNWYLVYWSNSKAIHMLYDYNTEHITKHSAMCYDEDINSTGKPLLSSNLSIVYQVSWPNSYGGGFSIQGSWVRIPLWVKFFYFVILASAPCSLKEAHAYEMNHDIHLANTLFFRERLDRRYMAAVCSIIPLFMLALNVPHSVLTNSESEIELVLVIWKCDKQS